MTNRTTLKTARLPKMMASLIHSNQFLKMFAFYSLTLLLVTVFALTIVATKEPLVITLDAQGRDLSPLKMAKPEDQITEAVKRYLDIRYKWNPKDVRMKLKASEAFILPNTLRVFQEAVSRVAKFSVEKLVSQTIYPEVVEVNLDKKSAFVKGERITSIQGMKAAGDLCLELEYESGPRTKENPWGIYFLKEIEK